MVRHSANFDELGIPEEALDHLARFGERAVVVGVVRRPHEQLRSGDLEGQHTGAVVHEGAADVAPELLGWLHSRAQRVRYL